MKDPGAVKVAGVLEVCKLAEVAAAVAFSVDPFRLAGIQSLTFEPTFNISHWTRTFRTETCSRMRFFFLSRSFTFCPEPAQCVVTVLLPTEPHV